MNQLKCYNVNYIEKGTFSLNGKGNNPLWDSAEILTDFVSAWDKEKIATIEFKSMWDFENIYFCFTVYDAMVYIDKKDDSSDSINNSDRVELFFRKDELLNPYYCLEIDPTSRIMDFMALPNKDFDFEWKWPKEQLKVQSTIDSSKFTVEISISIQSLKELDLIKDNKIETGIFRAKYKKQQDLSYEPVWISWVNPNTESPNFHTPSSFGVLQLLRP
ncbi:carbohydrate-binding family 9-like protein [Flavobacterium sp. WC2509]|uniref:carbohydrate-binding family 9-like protein n=1 Tax=Flavobacterium sp. WC2509 TaxID=3461406 RepID=UPI0040442301